MKKKYLLSKDKIEEAFEIDRELLEKQISEDNPNKALGTFASLLILIKQFPSLSAQFSKLPSIS